MPPHLLTPEKVRSIVTVPNVAIPTVSLAIGCLMIFCVMVALLHSGVISSYVCLVVNAIVIFASFTPMHDSAHGSLAKKQYRWLNDFVGVSCAFLLCIPYAPFRYLHLQHHQHTNDVEKDPDMYTGRGPWYILPLRWMSIEYHYYTIYLSKEVFFNRTMNERVLAITQLMFQYGLICYCLLYGYTTTVLFSWVFPGRIAVFFLALFFDYLPHRPHSHTRKENEYLTTSLIALWPSKSSVSLLTFPLLSQNYHNIHHLVPYIPFYMYETVWLQCKDELEKHGTQTIPIFGTMKKID